MRIGIDARFYSEQGHGRYIRNLIGELAQVDTENEYRIFLLKKDLSKFQIPNSRFQMVLADARWYTLKEQLFLPRIFYKEKLDLLHVPHWNVPLFYRKPFVVTIHDLTVSKFTSIRSTTLPYPVWKLKRLMYYVVLASALKQAKKIIAVSQFVKDDILKNYHIDPNKIVVTPEAVEQTFISDAKKLSVQDRSISNVKQKYGVNHQYLLYIGNVHPHKNIERLIRVFHRVYEDLSGKVRLVLVGKDDYFLERLKLEARNLKLDKGIVWTGFVPDDELIPLLKGSAAFVFPSLAEGFGIPPLEAMACGTPVVSSNATSLPEVCGSAAAYFNPTDEDEMYSQIKKVLEDADLRLSLIQNGYERVNQFSWHRLAQQTLDIYKSFT